MIAQSLQILMPEVALALYGIAALLAVVYTGKDKLAAPLLWATSAVFVLLALWISFGAGGRAEAFGGAIITDDFSRFAKVLILLAAAAILLMSEHYLAARGLLKFEYPVLIALAVLGMMVMVSSGDLMTLYMGLELQSLALYVIAAFRRDSVRSTEAGLKYFVLGALSSGLLLYGASLTYGFAGSTLFADIMAATEGGASLGLIFGLVFVLTGLAFKISAAPFHMWTPDVYEGSPTPVTAFFATAPKMAAMGLLARVAHDGYGHVVGDWQQILAFLALLSMFLGAIAAIGQKDIKRLMAYSSIAHMGFALMGLAAGTAMGVQSMLLYMAIYVTMNIGTFAFILSMERDGHEISDLNALSGYASHDLTRAVALAALMFALAGVPPLLGFWGKFAVLRAAWEAGLGWLAIAGVIASVIGAFYYLRIVYLMFFGDDRDEPLNGAMPAIVWGLFMGAALVMLLGVVNLFGLEALALQAAQALVQ